jgi:hypothetical protein
MNLKDVLKKKAEYPVRLIATKELDNVSINDELGIEVVDFSIGNLRCANKTNNMIVEIYYDKETWELNGEWVFKNI